MGAVTVELKLRHRPDATHRAEAWFLPGDSPRRWLDELARVGLAQPDTRLFVVPASVQDRAPAGLLVVPAKQTTPTPPPRGLACRLVAGRLFVPVDGVLHPPVTDDELRELCPLPVTFFHPVYGLSGFEPEAALHVWDLLKLPPETPGNWNLAQPGAPGLASFHGIELLQPVSLEDLFGDAPEEIGNEPLLDLPPAPDEPRENPVAQSGRAMRRLVGRTVAGLTRFAPQGATRRTWINDLEDWANRQLQTVNSQIDRLRNKELHRLLRLFDSDPESALRHSIPMSAFAHRGVAPPGSRLGSQRLEFDPRRLGGRAADFWNVPPDFQEVLRRRYREAADREMQLGRYRRAAYIYAELLGDLVSAANALKQGGHYRDAAFLYREHLKNPVEAARCLADGGLLGEAIEEYEKLGRWLDVADLHQRLGNHQAAEQAVRRVIDECLARDDRRQAAELLEQRLHAPDEALELLLRAWPDSQQAAICVTGAFELLARLGRHETALEIVAGFCRDPGPPRLALPLLTALSQPARVYPNENVRRQAADLSRVLVSQQLERPERPLTETAALMERLTELARNDRLLSRDTHRFLAREREVENSRRRVAPPSPRAVNRPVVVNRIELPRQMTWLCLRSEWHWFFAAGVSGKRLTLIRGVWDGDLQSTSWGLIHDGPPGGMLMEPTREKGRGVALIWLGGGMADGLSEKRFPASDQFFGTECVAGTPTWRTHAHWPVAYGDDALWTAHAAGQSLVVSCHDKLGRLQSTLNITPDLLASAAQFPEARPQLVAVGQIAALAFGNKLLILRGQSNITAVELPAVATGLVATLPHTRGGLVVLLEQGAVMHWLGATADELIELERDLQPVAAAFVPGGPLVLVAKSRLILIEVDSRGVRSVLRQEWSGSPPVGVCATASPAQFAVLNAAGELTVHQVPRS